MKGKAVFLNISISELDGHDRNKHEFSSWDFECLRIKVKENFG